MVVDDDARSSGSLRIEDLVPEVDAAAADGAAFDQGDLSLDVDGGKVGRGPISGVYHRVAGPFRELWSDVRVTAHDVVEPGCRRLCDLDDGIRTVVRGGHRDGVQ